MNGTFDQFPTSFTPVAGETYYFHGFQAAGSGYPGVSTVQLPLVVSPAMVQPPVVQPPVIVPPIAVVTPGVTPAVVTPRAIDTSADSGTQRADRLAYTGSEENGNVLFSGIGAMLLIGGAITLIARRRCSAALDRAAV